MAFRASAEKWRPLVVANAKGLPVEFLMAWIDYESGGNPASLGSPYEVGIFQVNTVDGPAFGGDVHTLHRNFAGASSQTATRALTDAEKLLQVTSGVAMAAAYAKHAEARIDWPRFTPDFWAMVKLRHGLPVLTTEYVAAFKHKHGRGPADWAEYARYLDTMTKDEATRISAAGGRYWGSNGKPAFSRFTHNAWASGKYGGAESMGSVGNLVVLALLLFGAFLVGGR